MRILLLCEMVPHYKPIPLFPRYVSDVTVDFSDERHIIIFVPLQQYKLKQFWQSFELPECFL